MGPHDRSPNPPTPPSSPASASGPRLPGTSVPNLVTTESRTDSLLHPMSTHVHTDPSATGPQAQTFKDYLRLLWGRKWLILLIVVVVTGGVEFLALQETPVYQSHARVVVPPPPPVIVNGVIQPQPRTEEFLATQAEVIASPEVATLVVQDLG